MVKIAGIQFSGHVDKEVNVQTAIRLVRDAAGRGAQIICLPELFSTMYFCVGEGHRFGAGRP
jgi:N-carbamoylputrescine amidase